MKGDEKLSEHMGGWNMNLDASIEEQPVHTRMMHAFQRIKKVNFGALMQMPQSEFFALQVIARYQIEHPDREGIYVSKLAVILQIASSQTSRMLRNLEERDLISRSIDTRDRRNTYVCVTENGKRMSQDITKQLKEYMDGVLESMGEEKVEKLVQLCNEMAESMEKEAEKRIGIMRTAKV